MVSVGRRAIEETGRRLLGAADFDAALDELARHERAQSGEAPRELLSLRSLARAAILGIVLVLYHVFGDQPSAGTRVLLFTEAAFAFWTILLVAARQFDVTPTAPRVFLVGIVDALFCLCLIGIGGEPRSEQYLFLLLPILSFVHALRPMWALASAGVLAVAYGSWAGVRLDATGSLPLLFILARLWVPRGALLGFVTLLLVRLRAMTERRVSWLLALAAARGVGVMAVGRDRRILYLSRHQSDSLMPVDIPLTGRCYEVLSGNGHIPCNHCPISDAFRRFDEGTDRNPVVSGIAWHVGRDGTLMPFWMIASLLKDKHGQPLAALAVMSPLLERFRLVTALQRSPVAIRLVAPDGRTLYENEHARSWLRTDGNGVLQDWTSVLAASVDNAFRYRQQTTEEITTVDEVGQHRSIRVVATPEIDHRGRVTLCLLLAVDVSDVAEQRNVTERRLATVQHDIDRLDRVRRATELASQMVRQAPDLEYAVSRVCSALTMPYPCGFTAATVILRRDGEEGLYVAGVTGPANRDEAAHIWTDTAGWTLSDFWASTQRDSAMTGTLWERLRARQVLLCADPDTCLLRKCLARGQTELVTEPCACLSALIESMGGFSAHDLLVPLTADDQMLGALLLTSSYKDSAIPDLSAGDAAITIASAAAYRIAHLRDQATRTFLERLGIISYLYSRANRIRELKAILRSGDRADPTIRQLEEVVRAIDEDLYRADAFRRSDERFGPQQVDVRELLSYVRDKLARWATPFTEIYTKVAEDVPENLILDFHSVALAWEELGRNGLEAMADRESKGILILYVTVQERLGPRTAASAPHLVVSFRDQGPGLGSSEADVFAFGRPIRSGHMGLGVPFARHVAQRHGGDVRLCSTSTEGTEMEFVVPLSRSTPKGGCASV